MVVESLRRRIFSVLSNLQQSWQPETDLQWRPTSLGVACSSDPAYIMRISRTSLFLIFLVTGQLLLTELACGAESFRLNAEILGALQFSKPQNVSESSYLGLSGEKNFNLVHVRADILLIEVFSMYCPVCQAQAPVANQLFDMIESDPKAKGRVKFIGIGLGNTPFEVDVFRKKYNIQFPLFPDDTMMIHKASSQDIRTPTFIVLKREGGKNLAVLQTHIGKISDVNAFYSNLIGSLRSR